MASIFLKIFIVLIEQKNRDILLRKEKIMIEYLGNHIGELASLMAVLAAILTAIFWSHKKLHSDLMEMKSNVNNANARIDNLYNVMMTFLMKDKK